MRLPGHAFMQFIVHVKIVRRHANSPKMSRAVCDWVQSTLPNTLKCGEEKVPWPSQTPQEISFMLPCIEVIRCLQLGSFKKGMSPWNGREISPCAIHVNCNNAARLALVTKTEIVLNCVL